MSAPRLVSDCCHWPLRVCGTGGEESKHWNACQRCGQPCEVVVQPLKQEVERRRRVGDRDE